MCRSHSRWILLVTLFAAGLFWLTVPASAEPDLSGPKQDTDASESRRFNGERVRQQPIDRLLQMREQLNLTDEQVAELRQVMIDHRAEVQESRRQTRELAQQAREAHKAGDREKAAELRDAIQKQRRTDSADLREAMAKVLTESQRQVLAERGRERPSMAGQNRRPNADSERAVHPDLRQLDLSDEQKAAIRAILSEQREAVETFRAEHQQEIAALRQRMAEARKNRDREAMVEALADARQLREQSPVDREATAAAIREVLTEAQREKWDAMRQRAEQRRAGRDAEGTDRGPRGEGSRRPRADREDAANEPRLDRNDADSPMTP